MTAFYLASRYGRRLELADYAEQLRKLGHQVTSRWLEGQHQADELEVAAAGEVHQVPEIARRFAEEDVEDVTFADVVVAFSEPPRSSASRGGRHVEFGMALGWVLAGYRSLDGGRRQVVVIGQRENVFHCLREVAVFPDWASFVATVDPAPDVADPSDPAVRCSFCGEWVDIEDATHTLIRLTETGAVVACHDRCLAQDEEAVR
jgi:hypothetical protein